MIQYYRNWFLGSGRARFELPAKMWGLTLAIAVSLLGGYSERVAATEPPASQTVTPPASFINKVWKVGEPSSIAPGMLYVFLSEGTLVMASPNSTPAFGKWKSEGGTLTTVIEEGISYKVNVVKLSDDEFKITLINPGKPTELRLIPAE